MSSLAQFVRLINKLLFAIEGRVGQRKLWGIVSLTRRYPKRCINAACAQALQEGVYSYKRVQDMTEALFAKAVDDMQSQAHGDDPVNTRATDLTQQHELIREAQEYGDLFTQAATSASLSAATTQGGQA